MAYNAPRFIVAHLSDTMLWNIDLNMVYYFN